MLSKSTILLFSLLNTKLYLSCEQPPFQWIRSELYFGSPQQLPVVKLLVWNLLEMEIS